MLMEWGRLIFFVAFNGCWLIGEVIYYGLMPMIPRWGYVFDMVRFPKEGEEGIKVLNLDI